MTTTTTLSELTGDYVLDPAGTRIGFATRQAVVTTVRGQFGEFEGTAHLDGDDPAKSRARITIQAASIQTSSQRRDDHLRRAPSGRPDRVHRIALAANMACRARREEQPHGDPRLTGPHR